MNITIGKVVSWTFGILFTLSGVGSMIESPIGGLIMAVTGIFLIPNVRQKIDQEYDLSFSRWMVVLIAVIGLGASAAFLPQQSLDDGTNSSPTEPSTENSASPDAVVEDYFNSLTGYNSDTETAYEMLSSNVQSGTSYADYDIEMENLKDAQMATTRELRSTEVINQSESQATVSITAKVDRAQGAYNLEEEVALVKEDGQWKIDQKLDVYN